MIIYILFQTADGCTKMLMGEPDFRPLPYITVQLAFPPETMDWVQKDPRDDQMVPSIATRRYRLEKEEVIASGGMQKILYTYIEVRS